MKYLAELLAIRSGEGRMAGLVLGLMLLTSMGSALGSAGIETLFFARLGVQFLPYMYMLLGVVTMGASLAVTAILSRVPRERMYLFLPLVLGILLLAGWLLLPLGFRGVYPVLWLGKEVINTLIGLLVWGAAAIVLDPRQARRLFPLFGAGRILGSVLGGFLTGWLVARLGTENLMLAWTATLWGSFLLLRALLGGKAVHTSRRRGRGSRASGFVAEIQQGYQYIRGSSLMRWISIASVLFSVLFFSIALPFSRAATQQFPDEAALAGFLGIFQGLSTAAAFLASLFLANRLFARFGIMSMILALPLIYVMGFGAMMLAPLFAVIITFRFIQMLWLSGVADSAYQAMFNVVPSERREQVRVYMSGVPDQAGTFLAGLVLLIGEQSFSPMQLSAVGLLAGLACAWAIWRARRAYESALMEALRLGRPNIFYSEEEPFGGFKRDSAATAALIAGLHSQDLVVRRVASEILGQIQIPEAGQELQQALQDADPVVRMHTLRALMHNNPASLADEWEHILADPEPDVRVEAIRCLLQEPSSAKASGILEPMLSDPSVRVRVQAASALLQLSHHSRAYEILAELIMSDDEEARLAALAAIPSGFELVAQQLDDRRPPIRHAAAAALLRLDTLRALPLVIPMLADPEVQQGVAETIAKSGDKACQPLMRALSDPELQQGALLAITKLPSLLDVGPVKSFARTAASHALEYHALQRSVAGESERARLLKAVLREKALQNGLNALKAIGLLGDRDQMSLALETLVAEDLSQRGYVLEVLESLAESQPLVRPLLGLWDEELSGTGTPVPGLQEILPRMLGDPDPWLRACAAFFALEQNSCLPLLEELSTSGADPLVRELLAGMNGDIPLDTLPTLSLMERIFFFKRVSLFERLSTVELKNVAAISEELLFADGEQLALQNEIGETMYLIVSGEISVSVALPDGSKKEIAHRRAGDCVGEMSIISQEPRIATLEAVGDVRALCIDRKNFQSLLRERPEVSLGVMQVLCTRIGELSR